MKYYFNYKKLIYRSNQMIKKIVIAGASTFTYVKSWDEAMLLNLIQQLKDTIRKLRLLII